MNFDFSVSNTPAVSNSSRRLTPWQIAKVHLANVEKVSFQGKKDPSQTYDVLRIRFENEDGYYEESVFYPKDNDNLRPKRTATDGHEYEAPSNWERTKILIAQIATVLNPEGFKKMQEISNKFKSFDDMVKAFTTILNKDDVKAKEVELKLVGRTRQDGTVDPCLPMFVGVTKQGELFVSDNFIGNKLFFSPREEQKRQQFLNAKPTDVSANTSTGFDLTNTPESAKDNGIDLSDLY